MESVKRLIKYRNIFGIEVSILKPPKSKIVIYDPLNSVYLKKRLKRFGKIQVFDNRFQSINFYIFFKTILKHGFLNLKKKYKIVFFQTLSPKIVVSLSDVNPGFYLLKEDTKIKNLKTICIQNAHRSDMNFINFKRNLKKNYSCDYFFIFSKDCKKLYKKYINTKKIKFFSIGSFVNNENKINIKKKKGPLKITYISQFKNSKKYFSDEFLHEKKIIDIIQDYIKNKNIEFNIALRTWYFSGTYLSYNDKIEQSLNSISKYYKKYFSTNTLKLVGNLNFKKNNYYNLDQADLGISESSTLGLESISRGLKVLFVPIIEKKLYYNNNKKKISDKFICNKLQKKNLQKKIDYLIGLSKSSWSKIISRSNFNYKYDKNNKIFSQEMNKLL